jgi:VWFA-related protein
MFEARFDQPMSIPAKALQANAPPAVPPANDSQVVATSRDETQAEESQNPRRPVLKRRDGQTAETRPGGEAAPSDTPLPPPEVISSESTAPASTPDAPPEPVIASNTEPLPPGSTVPTFGVKVRMVQVDAVVRDKSGRMVDNLKREDFLVYEDGVLQQIETFSRDQLPLAVALVVDRSGSVAPYISELRKIASRALSQLKSQDQVCLFSFAASVDRLEGLTTDRRRIADAIDRIQAGGGTNIVDALYDSVNYLARTAPNYRHAVILISDNQQTVNPQMSESETIKKAMESDTVIYSLKTSGDVLNIGAQLPSIFKGGNVSKIAQETGGEVINVRQASSIDTAFGVVISRLRMRYSFGYYPTDTAQGGMFHEIKVRLTDPHGKAGSDYFMHAKRGYYATSSRT